MEAVRSITHAELLDALAQALPTAPNDARTVDELCQATGWNETRVRKSLRAYMQQGKLMPHTVRRPAIDGTLRPTTAYTLKP
jgi:hypothetical protein